MSRSPRARGRARFPRRSGGIGFPGRRFLQHRCADLPQRRQELALLFRGERHIRTPCPLLPRRPASPDPQGSAPSTARAAPRCGPPPPSPRRSPRSTGACRRASASGHAPAASSDPPRKRPDLYRQAPGGAGTPVILRPHEAPQLAHPRPAAPPVRPASAPPGDGRDRRQGRGRAHSAIPSSPPLPHGPGSLPVLRGCNASSAGRRPVASPVTTPPLRRGRPPPSSGSQPPDRSGSPACPRCRSSRPPRRRQSSQAAPLPPSRSRRSSSSDSTSVSRTARRSTSEDSASGISAWWITKRDRSMPLAAADRQIRSHSASVAITARWRRSSSPLIAGPRRPSGLTTHETS